jgi:hypothetical protein
MPAAKLLLRLIIYYAVVAAVVWVLLQVFPHLSEYLPIGRLQTLVAQAGGPPGRAANHVLPATSTGGSLVWLIAATVGSLLTAWPVSRVYIEIRLAKDYDQSLVDTIVVLPVVVTSIVVLVQNSLALSFSLAGIAGAARFRNSMKSSADLLFVLLAIGIGLAAGIGAMELAVVTTIAFNLSFIALWSSNYGERAEMKRYLADTHHLSDTHPAHNGNEAPIAGLATAGVAGATHEERVRDDDDD